MREAFDRWLRGVVGGRRFVVVAPMLQSAGNLATRVTRFGADRCFLLGGRLGTGDLPPDELGPQHVLGLPSGGITESIHAAERAFGDLPSEVLAAIDAFDPERLALVLAPFFSNGQPVAGRRMFGGRPASWRALEDKVVIDAVWDAAGVPRAPCEIVDLAQASAAGRRLDVGEGTVWAGDARDGFNGGASRTHWVRDEGSARAAVQLLENHTERVRVMPFLEGIPCSVHGLVLPEHVLAFRPAEMVVLRRTSSSGFKYVRAATTWDPPAADREAMRALVRLIGTHLRATVGYRGAFTLDGVMTREGFRPTELNPRVGAAMGMIVRDLPIGLLHYALIEGAEFPVDPLLWEEAVLLDADENRTARLGFTFDRDVRRTRKFALIRRPDGCFVEQDGDEGADVLGIVGPGPSGGFVNFVPQDSVLEIGRSVGPLAAALVAWSDASLDTRVGPVEPALSVR